MQLLRNSGKLLTVFLSIALLMAILPSSKVLAQDPPEDEAAALAYVQANTTLTGDLDELTATFPLIIPPVIVAESYQINSRMTLADELPVGTTVTIMLAVNGSDPFLYIDQVAVPGTFFWITDLLPGSVPADFDTTYGGRIEVYSITLNSGGNLDLVETEVKIESIISKDGFTTDVVLADITLPISFEAVPIAEADTFSTKKNQNLIIDSPGVLANDMPPTGVPQEALVAILHSKPPAGEGHSLVLGADGSFYFNPRNNWTGTTSFTYQACNGFSCSNPTTVTVNVWEKACLVVSPEKLLPKSLYPDSTGKADIILTNICQVDVSFDLKASMLVSPFLSEGFESGAWPPENWETQVINHQNTWKLTTKSSEVDEGQFAAWVMFDPIQDSDEWLLTPVLDANSATDLVLSFRAYSTTNWPDATVKVWVLSADDGEPLTAEPLWDLVRDSYWIDPFFGFRSVLVDLGDIKEPFRIGWQYIGKNGDSFFLDAIKIGSHADVPWMALNPASGTIPAEGMYTITVDFDSSGMEIGEYRSLLSILNAPYPVITVPVRLLVRDSASQYYLPLILKSFSDPQ